MKAKDELARLAAKLANGSIDPEEPLFTLRAKDWHAAFTVEYWCGLCRTYGGSVEKIDEAEGIARQMRSWPIKQLPGIPQSREDNS